MDVLLARFGLRPKLAQLTPEVIGIDMRLVAFNLDGVHVRFHVDPKFFKFLDFGSSLLQAMLTAASARPLSVKLPLKIEFPLISVVLLVIPAQHARHS